MLFTCFLYAAQFVPSRTKRLFFPYFPVLPQAILIALSYRFPDCLLFLPHFKHVMPFPCKDYFPLTTNFLLPPTLTVSHLKALFCSHSFLLAQDDVQLSLVSALSHPKTPLRLPFLDNIHPLVLSMLQRSPFWPLAPSPYTRPQFLYWHLTSPPALPCTSSASKPLAQKVPSTQTTQDPRLAVLRKEKADLLHDLNSHKTALNTSKRALELVGGK